MWIRREEYEKLQTDSMLKKKLEDEVERLAELISAEVKDCKVGPWCKGCKYIGTDKSEVYDMIDPVHFGWMVTTAGRVQYCKKHLYEVCPEFELKG